jgi:hypothetical protein
MLRFDQRQSAAAVNVWNTFAELEQPFSLLCSGIEIKHPQTRIENDRVVMHIKQRKDAINIDMYCDNDHQELVDVHPERIIREQAKIDSVLAEYSSYLDNDWYHFAGKLLTKKAWWPDRHMELQLVSPFVHWLTSHYFYEDLCRVQLPDGDAFKCALAYQYLKKHDDFDRVMDFDRSFFGYPDD